MDCIWLGVVYFYLEVDWVIVGINVGGNMGIDFYLFGIVVVVWEVVIFGYKAIVIFYWINKFCIINWVWVFYWVNVVFNIFW